MRNERLTAAIAVRDAYLPLKKECDAVALQAARCVLIMQEQRRASGMRIGTGADAIADVSRGAALVAQGVAAIAAAHPKLADLIRDAGLERHYPYGYGGEDTPPNTPSGIERTGPTLQVVAA